MKLLYIAGEFGVSNGTNTNMMVHYRALIRILGKENVFTVDLNSGGKQIETTESVSYLKPTALKDKLLRGMQGHTSLMSNKIMRDICDIIRNKNINYVFIDDSLYGKLVKRIKKEFPQITVATFYHDVKRNLYLQWIKKDGVGAALKRYIPGLINEKSNAKYSDINITLNSRETKMLRRYYNVDSQLELPVGIAPPAPKNEFANVFPTDKINLLFLGAKYYANIEGIRWFCENVMPFINASYHLWIAGKGMECLSDELTSNNVTVLGTLDTLSDYYRDCNIVIAPIFDGAGMKVKTAEALAYGKCFVVTKEAEVGYMEYRPESCNELFLQCNTAEEFIACLNKLSGKDINKFNPQISQFFEANYSLAAIDTKLRSVLPIDKG